VIDDNGYYLGGGMMSPDKKNFYFAIPKNASTYLTNLLKANNWTHWNILDNPAGIEKTMVFVRDPLDRWISGFATYAALRLFGFGYGSDHFVEDYNDLSKRIIFDQIIFDDHTDLQVNYIKQILDYNPIFFRYNKNLVPQINYFLGYNLNTDVAVHNNDSESNFDTKQISNFMKQEIDSNPDLKAKIVKCYKQDYEFIDSIDFYSISR
jgi:hypothetical protein